MKSTPYISVIIVNWNGRQFIGPCLDSLREQLFRDFEIIVVDNGSQDGSVEYIRRQFPETVLLALSHNLGFAGGSNAGIKASTGRYIALLNNDTIVSRDWLTELVRAVEDNSSVGMWASKILSMDNPEILDNTGLLLYWDGIGRGRGRLEDDRGQYDSELDVFFPSGCAALFSREVLDMVGLFDEEYFAYADDVDLGLRSRLAGWGCRYVPTARVYHKYSASSSAHSPFKAYLVERNRIWVLLKYFPWQLIVVSPYFTLKRLLMQLYASLAGKGASGRFTERYSIWSAIWVLLRAWVGALKGLPRVLRQRSQFNTKIKITMKDFYRLMRTFSISAKEVALKE